MTDGKYDHAKMREAIAKWEMINEHPFTIVEEDGFHLMMKVSNPYYQAISRHTVKKDCMLIYENEKKKLKNLLRTINKISLTTNL